MADQRKTEREEPQRTRQHEEQIRGVGERDEEFDDLEDFDEEDADDEDEGTI